MSDTHEENIIFKRSVLTLVSWVVANNNFLCLLVVLAVSVLEFRSTNLFKATSFTEAEVRLYKQ